jgi:DNA polymerase-1
MKRKTWLILDANYLCWRAHHTTGGLSWRGKPTGVIYGFLRDIKTFQDLFATEYTVFCFDYSRKHLLRKVDFPAYKANRDQTELSEVQQEMFDDCHRQIRHLRNIILPELGYRNVLAVRGYEADDLIASVCGTLNSTNNEQIIIGADHDLYQLLSPNTIIYNPTKGIATTQESFGKEYGVTPSQWVDVKAIAGCSSDNIPGIKGIGEKTAAKFINGTLPAKSKAHKLIITNNQVWKKNKFLVKLPYPGTPTFKLRKDRVDEGKWKQLLNNLGIRSLSRGKEESNQKGNQKTSTKTKTQKPRKGFGL